MPQLDKFTFFTQVVYFLIFFFSFYLLSSRLILPRFFSILKVRRKQLNTLKTRNGFLENSEGLIKTYEQKIMKVYLQNAYTALTKIMNIELSTNFNNKLKGVWSNNNTSKIFTNAISNVQNNNFLVEQEKSPTIMPTKNSTFTFDSNTKK